MICNNNTDHVSAIITIMIISVDKQKLNGSGLKVTFKFAKPFYVSFIEQHHITL